MGTEEGEIWAGGAYAASAGHHRRLDDWFLRRLPPRPTDVVVDMGCGSGEFSARLAALVPQGQVIGIDSDPSMLRKAQEQQGANLRLLHAPAEEIAAQLKSSPEAS